MSKAATTSPQYFACQVAAPEAPSGSRQARLVPRPSICTSLPLDVTFTTTVPLR